MNPEYKGAILSKEEDGSDSILSLGKGRKRFFKKLAWVLAGGLAIGIGISAVSL